MISLHRIPLNATNLFQRWNWPMGPVVALNSISTSAPITYIQRATAQWQRGWGTKVQFFGRQGTLPRQDYGIGSLAKCLAMKSSFLVRGQKVAHSPLLKYSWLQTEGIWEESTLTGIIYQPRNLAEILSRLLITTQSPDGFSRVCLSSTLLWFC